MIACNEVPEYSPDGIDLTLIRWFLTLTPAERLAALEEHLDEIEQIRKLNSHDPLQESRSKEHKLLITRFGPLDVLGTIGSDLSYEDLLPRTSVRLGTETLRRTLEERNRR